MSELLLDNIKTLFKSFTLLYIYTGTGEDIQITLARRFKNRNPNIKILFYQPADRFGDSPFVTDFVQQHPEMWLRDDDGNLIPFPGTTGEKRVLPYIYIYIYLFIFIYQNNPR